MTTMAAANALSCHSLFDKAHLLQQLMYALRNWDTLVTLVSGTAVLESRILTGLAIVVISN